LRFRSPEDDVPEDVHQADRGQVVPRHGGAETGRQS
jgi:hypothetical protein